MKKVIIGLACILLTILEVSCNKEERIQGEQFTVSGYLKPQPNNADSVLSNELITFVISIKHTTLPNRYQTHSLTTDSAGYFTFQYQNPDYYESDGLRRKTVELVSLVLGDKSSLLEYVMIPPQCNLVNKNFYPRSLGGSDSLFQYCE